MPNAIKSLGYISSATARIPPDLLKSQTILPDTTVRRSAVDREDLKPNWKSEKLPYFSRWSTSLLSTGFSKALLTTERLTLFLDVDLFQHS